MKTIILVATHKEYRMPDDPMYLPVYAGDPNQNVMHYEDGMSGENISTQNDKYCELTRAYWAWKNLDSDNIGLCQYRRHFTLTNAIKRIRKDKFDCVLTKEQIERLLSNYDVVLPKPRRLYIETVGSHFIHAHGQQYFDIIKELISKNCPDYTKSFDKVMGRSHVHFNNMFIMRWPQFDSYCAWLFPILFEFERSTDFSNCGAWHKRLPAYIAERLLDVWLEHNKLTYCEVNILFMEKQDWFMKRINFLKRKFFYGKGMK